MSYSYNAKSIGTGLNSVSYPTKISNNLTITGTLSVGSDLTVKGSNVLNTIISLSNQCSTTDQLLSSSITTLSNQCSTTDISLSNSIFSLSNSLVSTITSTTSNLKVLNYSPDLSYSVSNLTLSNLGTNNPNAWYPLDMDFSDFGSNGGYSALTATTTGTAMNYTTINDSYLGSNQSVLKFNGATRYGMPINMARFTEHWFSMWVNASEASNLSSVNNPVISCAMTRLVGPPTVNISAYSNNKLIGYSGTTLQSAVSYNSNLGFGDWNNIIVESYSNGGNWGSRYYVNGTQALSYGGNQSTGDITSTIIGGNSRYGYYASNIMIRDFRYFDRKFYSNQDTPTILNAGPNLMISPQELTNDIPDMTITESSNLIYNTRKQFTNSFDLDTNNNIMKVSMDLTRLKIDNTTSISYYNSYLIDAIVNEDYKPILYTNDKTKTISRENGHWYLDNINGYIIFKDKTGVTDDGVSIFNTYLSNTLCPYITYYKYGATKKSFMSSNINVDGNCIVSNKLYVNNDTFLNSNLTIVGTSTLSNNLTVVGTSTLSGTLGVSGIATFSNNLTVNGTTTLNSSLSSTGLSTFSSRVGIGTTATHATYPLIVSNGYSLFEKNVLVSEAIRVSKYVEGGWSANIRGTITDTTGFANMSQGLRFLLSGATGSMSDSIGLDTNKMWYQTPYLSKHSFNIDAKEYAYIDSTGLYTPSNLISLKTVSASNVSSSNMTCLNTLTSSNITVTNSLISSNLSLNNTLNVTGVVSLSNKLNVTGTSTFSSNLVVSGNYNTTLGGTLNITGTTTHTSNLVVSGNYNTTLGGTLNVSGVSAFSNNIGIGSYPTNAKLYVRRFASDSSTMVGLVLGNGDYYSSFNKPQIQFSYDDGTNLGWSHFIRTRHQGGTPPTLGNAIDFYTCDGTQTNSISANVTHNLSMYGGNVGIGTLNPMDPLQTHSTYTASGLWEGNGVSLSVTNGGANWLCGCIEPYVAAAAGNSTANYPGGLLFRTSTANNISTVTKTATAVRMVIDSQGYVGINITNPQYQLDVTGATRLTGSHYIGSGASDTFQSFCANNFFNNYVGMSSYLGVNGATANSSYPLIVTGHVLANDYTTQGSTGGSGTMNCGTLNAGTVSCTTLTYAAGNVVISGTSGLYITRGITGGLGSAAATNQGPITYGHTYASAPTVIVSGEGDGDFNCSVYSRGTTSFQVNWSTGGTAATKKISWIAIGV
jgi:predicted acyltransferase (DUF342 family)